MEPGRRGRLEKADVKREAGAGLGEEEAEEAMAVSPAGGTRAACCGSVLSDTRRLEPEDRRFGRPMSRVEVSSWSSLRWKLPGARPGL